MAPVPTFATDAVATDDAYEVFWHAAEDDVRVTSFDDEAETLSDADDVYFAFVAAVEA
jgi:hypothetical protein